MKVVVMAQRIMYKGNPYYRGETFNVLPGDEGKFAVCIARDNLRVVEDQTPKEEIVVKSRKKIIKEDGV